MICMWLPTVNQWTYYSVVIQRRLEKFEYNNDRQLRLYHLYLSYHGKYICLYRLLPYGEQRWIRVYLFTACAAE